MTIANLLVALMRDPELRSEIVSLLREAAPEREAAEHPTLLTRAELAKGLRVSVATVTRLDPPAVIVGDATTKRYDLAAVRAFLAEREPKPTTPAKREPTVDVTSSLSRARLRRAS